MNEDYHPLLATSSYLVILLAFCYIYIMAIIDLIARAIVETSPDVYVKDEVFNSIVEDGGYFVPDVGEVTFERVELRDPFSIDNGVADVRVVFSTADEAGLKGFYSVEAKYVFGGDDENTGYSYILSSLKQLD